MRMTRILRISDCELRIADCKILSVSIRNRQFAIRNANNPQSAIRNWAPTLMLMVFCSLPITVVAEVSKNNDKRLEGAQTTQGGPGATSSNFQQQLSVGMPFSSELLQSSSYQLRPGLLWTAATSGTVIPVTELDISVLSAKTHAFGEAIPEKTWQKDRDPYFYWEPPATGLELAGYSYALDTDPDDVVDTTQPSLDVASSTLEALSDGQHTFSVKAINSAGQTGAPIAFEFWIDTTPPQIASYSPGAGVLLNTQDMIISANVSDGGCGLSATGITLELNGKSLLIEWDGASGIVSASTSALSPWKEGSNSLELKATDLIGNSQTPLVFSVTMDTVAPSGSVMINENSPQTTSIYVMLTLSATDAVSGVDRVLISNEEFSGYVEEPFVSIRPLWRLETMRGSQRVFVKFIDEAGNISESVSDDIELQLLSPDTVITNGPSGIVLPGTPAVFSFMCPEGGCVFSYAFDHDDWSGWSSMETITQAELGIGNHYFRVKAARESNGIDDIQADEEDPSPAERTWIISVETVPTIPQGPPVKLWRLE